MALGLMVGAADRPDRPRLARLAEEAGFSVAYLTEAAGVNAFMDGAQLAQHTDDIRIAVGIVNVYSRSPSLIAMSGAHLDQLTGGRAVVCLGASTQPLVEGVHGIPFERPIERMREYIEIIRVGWSGDRFDYDGEFFSPSGGRVVLPTEQERLPLGIAALGSKNRELTGETADVWLPHLVPRSIFGDVEDHVHGAARDAGRDPDEIETHAYVPTAVADDREAAREKIRMHIASYIGPASSYRNMVARVYPDEAAAIHEAWQARDREEATALVTEEMVDDLGIAGPPDEARDAMTAWGEVADTVVYHYPPRTSTADIEASIEAGEPLT